MKKEIDRWSLISLTIVPAIVVFLPQFVKHKSICISLEGGIHVGAVIMLKKFRLEHYIIKVSR